MAERERTKAKRITARPEEASVSDALQRLEARSKALELERDGLKAELEAARLRIGSLEAARDKVVDRIDGMITSLNSVVGND